MPWISYVKEGRKRAASSWFNMASLPPLQLAVLCLLLALTGRLRAEPSCIAVYWGQNGYERGLREACATGYYNDIISCQQDHNVTVMLSLGGAIGNYNLVSEEDAREVATYI
ncbi:unnamed protein product [Musa acuminata subsp. malaccensis]|uniref:(wild Malaysian banana) hypothetical protein n=1 Tax=Musa acuminata subsp. malaccensis TaxID=214687 RepID=A0A804IJ80_MUSAM|nr:unnamed protein product [Musa acuminata subsp. malaccensis]